MQGILYLIQAGFSTTFISAKVSLHSWWPSRARQVMMGIYYWWYHDSWQPSLAPDGGAEKKLMKNRITCYSAGQQLPGIHFFILSKGLNAGKPLDAACPNCFVFSCKSEEDRDKYFWICYGLWQSNHFRVHLVGSVIPFLRKSELVMLVDRLNDF